MKERHEPGRELDVLIAERVFGHTVNHWIDSDGRPQISITNHPKGLRGLSALVPHYSTYNSDAWTVVEHLRTKHELECYIHVNPPGWSVLNTYEHPELDPTLEVNFLCQFVKRMGGWPKGNHWPVGHGRTMPEAVCRAALIATGTGEDYPWK